jgi:hypothetical protein
MSSDSTRDGKPPGQGPGAVEPPIGIEPMTYALRGPSEPLASKARWPLTCGNSARHPSSFEVVCGPSADHLRTVILLPALARTKKLGGSRLVMTGMLDGGGAPARSDSSNDWRRQAAF